MKNLLKSFGVGGKEAETFLKLLELGGQPVSVVAKYTGVPRSTMYLILDNLKKAGLVEEFERMGIKYFRCISVDCIFDVLAAKEARIKEARVLLEQNMHELKKMENKLSITPRVRFFEGKDAVMKMYEEVCKQKKIDAYFNPRLVKNIMPEYFYKVAEMIKANKGSAREVLVDCSAANEYKQRFRTKAHQIKILSEGVLFKSDTIIVLDRFYMISYGERDVSAVEICNKSLADTQRVVFEQWWGMI